MNPINTIRVPRVAPSIGVWSYLVKARDNFSCQQCGASGEDVELNAHHKNTTNDLKLVISNGISLCYSCHCKAHNSVSSKTPNRKRCESQTKVIITISNIAKLLDVSVTSLCGLIEDESKRRKLAEQAHKEALKIVAKHAAYNRLIETIFGERKAFAQVSFEKEAIIG